MQRQGGFLRRLQQGPEPAAHAHPAAQAALCLRPLRLQPGFLLSEFLQWGLLPAPAARPPRLRRKHRHPGGRGSRAGLPPGPRGPGMPPHEPGLPGAARAQHVPGPGESPHRLRPQPGDPRLVVYGQDPPRPRAGVPERRLVRPRLHRGDLRLEELGREAAPGSLAALRDLPGRQRPAQRRLRLGGRTHPLLRSHPEGPGQRLHGRAPHPVLHPGGEGGGGMALRRGPASGHPDSAGSVPLPRRGTDGGRRPGGEAGLHRAQ